MNQPESHPLTILCLGAGAIGTYIGGSLSASGQRVVFLEREQPAEALRRTGLTVRTASGQVLTSRPEIVSRLEDALAQGPFDAAFLAVKSFDTQSVADSLAPFRSQLPPVVCLQNGVENELTLAKALGDDQIIAATVTTAIGRLGLGEVQVERLRGVGIASQTPLAERLVAAMTAAGLSARQYADPGSLKWSKMLTNLLANASSAILDLPPVAIFSHPGLYRVEMRQIREALRVMDALDLSVVDLPGTPVRLLAFIIRRLPPALSRPLLWRAVGKGRGNKMPSFHIDLHQGRGQSEVTYLNGAVARYGERLGVRTPVNRFLTETLLALVENRLPLDTYAGQPDKFLSTLAAADASR
jgi:2-dehydropantoate 2-reductase